jgi:hypothetical protein
VANWRDKPWLTSSSSPSPRNHDFRWAPSPTLPVLARESVRAGGDCA